MSQSPIRPRNLRTSVRNASVLTYEDVSSTAIGGKGEYGESSGTARQTRKSTRKPQLSKEKSATQDDCESRCSSGNSNIENEEKGVREDNENTPQPKPTGSRLSRKRSTRIASSSASFSVVSSINEDDKIIKLNFKRQPQQEAESTPKTNERPKRKSVLRSCGQYRSNFHNLYSDSDSDEDKDNKKTTRKGSASYFSEKDWDEFRPGSETDEEEPVVSSGEQDEESSVDDNSESEEDESDPVTPNKRPLLQNDLTKLTLTPELLNRIEGRSIRRRIGVNSPVATGSQTMSPNPESYFLAETRIKYKGIVKQSECVMNDAMKGNRRRKKRMMDRMESRLPEKIPSDFSVTAEAMKATVTPADYVEGNVHEEKVEDLFRSIVDNEFPHWLGLFRDGFNVMLYGYGSKLPVLRKFEEMVNNHFLTVTINGLFPKLNARKLLYGICEYVNPDAPIPHGVNLEASAKETVQLLKNVNHSDVFILINNFDNLALRYPQILAILCWLAQVSYIHIMASCDTVNAFLGVTQSQALQLNFCWMHCATYKSYREEFKWTPGIYGDETKIVTQKSSLKYVLQSLTGNARKAFALLAQMQLKQMKSRAVRKAKEAYAGVRFQELAKECREKFIAHSDENLRTLLVEFFDHKLIKQTGKGKHLENTLLVELDVETLEEIMSDLI